MKLALLLLLPFALLADDLGNPSTLAVLVAPAAGGGGGGGVTYLVKQDFEGAGYDNSESWTEVGAPDEDFTGTVLDGSQSCQVATGTTTTRDWSTPALSTAYVYFIVQSTTPGANGNLMTLQSSDGSAMTSVVYLSSGNFRVSQGVQNSGNVAVVSGTTYHVWVKFIKGTSNNGTSELYVSTTSTKPGSPSASLTNGSSTQDATKIQLRTPTGVSSIFDKVRVDDADIGSTPE